METAKTVHQDFDPETGEVLDVEGETLTGTVPEQLNKLMRWIVGKELCLTHLVETQPNCTCEDCNLRSQIDHIKERLGILNHRAMDRLRKLQEGCCALEEQAKCIMDARGETNFKVPGFGKFAYRKQPETVDITGYGKMTHEGVKALQENCPELFNFKVEPNLKSIKRVYKSIGDDGLAALEEAFGTKSAFGLTRKDDVFSFTPEK